MDSLTKHSDAPSNDLSPERLTSRIGGRVFRIDSVHAPVGLLDKNEPDIHYGVTDKDEESNGLAAKNASRGNWSWPEILLLFVSLGMMAAACFFALIW